MKRQSEELFFNYKTKPRKAANNDIIIDVPDDIEFIPGDIIDMIVSENTVVGGVSYCARLICYKYNHGGYKVDVGLLSGLLEDEIGDYSLPALLASLLIKDGKKSVWIRSNVGTTVSLDESAEFLVNIIIHRSKKEIELYYVG